MPKRTEYSVSKVTSERIAKEIIQDDDLLDVSFSRCATMLAQHNVHRPRRAVADLIRVWGESENKFHRSLAAKAGEDAAKQLAEMMSHRDELKYALAWLDIVPFQDECL